LQSNEFKTKNRSKNKGILGNFHGKWKTSTHFNFLNLFNIQGIIYSSPLHFYMIENNGFHLIPTVKIEMKSE